MLHVLEKPSVSSGFVDPYVLPAGGDRQPTEHQARIRLSTLLTAEQRANLSAVLGTRNGQPAEQILDYIREAGIDLVVMATAGRGAVMSSITDRIIRNAPCPVLTVRPYDRMGTGTGDRAA